jgi:RNA polymerase sigma-70 factor (ECF subfamily)
MMHQNETQIINRILEGNVREYAVLVNRHKDLAFTLAYRLLNNREDAEEAVQDAFVKAYRNLAGFRKDSRFSTWLFRIVYNTAISKKRLKKTVFNSIDEKPFIKESYDKPEEETDSDEDTALTLETALQKLSEEERLIITLFYINESSVEEIHSITGLSKSNIKIKLFRARKKLQELVGFITEKTYI